MNVRMVLMAAAATLGAMTAPAPSQAQAYDYRAQRGPALGRVSPAPSINRMGPAYGVSPGYRRPVRVCTTRLVRERRGDRVIERRVTTCREHW